MKDDTPGRIVRRQKMDARFWLLIAASAALIALLAVMAHRAVSAGIQAQPGVGEPPQAAVADSPPPVAPPPDWRVPERYSAKILSRRVCYFQPKVLALTFDDGPDPAITPRVLETLARYDARATFFVEGRLAEAHSGLLAGAAAAGHAIGNHSYTHPKDVSARQAAIEVSRTDHAIELATGIRPSLFRPPYGKTGGELAKAALKSGHTVVLWTISSADSRPIPPETIASNVIHTPNPGDIVLMHDGEGHAATVKGLEQVLKELTAAGYRFVTLPELMRSWDSELAAREKRTDEMHVSGR